MITARTLAVAGATLFFLPALLGLKCVDYDPRFGGAGTPDPGDGPSGDGASTTPAKACANPAETIFQVSNYAFNIQCGCVESKGKICTVPVGTTVKWQFVDSTSHNVTSIANTFGGSPDTSAGMFQKIFTTPGTYRYGCSIHAFDMSGYRMEVRASASPGTGGAGGVGGVGGGGMGGGAAADPDELSADERALLDEHFAPLPAQLPPNLTNRWADNAAAATLGQKLFFLTGYSSTVKVDGPTGMVGQPAPTLSCATCHDPENWFIDPRSPLGTSHGVQWSPRHSPSIVNAGNYRFYSWAGKQDSMWMQGANSMEGGNFGGNRLQYVHLIYAKFQAEYDALFAVPLDPALAAGAAGAARFPAAGRPKAAATDPDGPWEMMAAADREIVNVIVSNTGKALEAYQRKVVSRNSGFERYLKGDRSALTGEQKRGLKLFIGSAGCASCHSGPSLTNDGFSNVAVPQMADHAPAIDLGRYDDAASLLTNAFNGAGRYSDNVAAGMEKLSRVVSRQESDRGAFRVKLLWNVEKTPPYFHNGSMATLEQVVHHYNLGGAETGFSGVKDAKMKALGLTAIQEAELVAFLKALTGDPVPAALRVNPLAL